MVSDSGHDMPPLSPAGPRAPQAILRITHRTIELAPDGDLDPVVGRAKAAGAHMLEFDVQTTADAQLVVYHDSLIDGAARGQVWVRDLSLYELRSLVANAFAVERVIDAARESGLGIYVDIKSLTRQSVAGLCQVLAARGMRSRCILASRRIDLLSLCAQVAPDVPRSVLFSGPHEDPVDLAVGAAASFVHPCWERLERPDRLLTDHWLTRVRRQGLGVVCWHEERPAVIGGLYQRGVDAICSDRPELLLAEVRRRLTA